MTLLLSGIFLSIFGIMFYLEDREGGGLYDPDPSASYRHRNRKKK